MATLSNGLYYIRNKGTDQLIGRSYMEDKSLNPKRVLNNPQSTDSPQWEIVMKDDRTYVLKSRGGSAITNDGMLFASIYPEQPEEHWVIKASEIEDENTYTLEKPNEPAGWTVQDQGDNTQVAIRPLVSTKSIPPRFLPAQLFVITPVRNDD